MSGALASREQCPAIPYTPAEYAAEARRVVDEGGVMVHLHARTPDGKPAHEISDFRAITDAIKAEVGDAVTGVPVGTTEENLKSAIEGETYEYTEMYPGFARTARDEGLDSVGDWFDYVYLARDPAGNQPVAGATFEHFGHLAAGETNSPEVRRGVEHLLRTQRSDGLWEDAWFTAPGFPRVFYLRYHGYSKYFPLWALARYRRASSSTS